MGEVRMRRAIRTAAAGMAPATPNRVPASGSPTFPSQHIKPARQIISSELMAIGSDAEGSGDPAAACSVILFQLPPAGADSLPAAKRPQSAARYAHQPFVRPTCLA